MMKPLLIVMLVCLSNSAALADDDGPHTRAELIAEHDSAIPGQTLFIGLRLDIDEHWHVYWNGLNDSGYPIQLELEAPAGYEIGQVLWPAPERLVHADGEILDHVYHDSVTLIVPITVPTEANAGESVTITGSADWLVCKTVCILESEDKLTITLPIAAYARRSGDAPHFDKTRSRLPSPIGQTDGVEVKRSGDTLNVFSLGASTIAFYPASECATPIDAITEGEARGPRLSMRFDAEELRTEPIRGVLEVVTTSPTGFESRVYSIELPPG